MLAAATDTELESSHQSVIKQAVDICLALAPPMASSFCNTLGLDMAASNGCWRRVHHKALQHINVANYAGTVVVNHPHVIFQREAVIVLSVSYVIIS